MRAHSSPCAQAGHPARAPSSTSLLLISSTLLLICLCLTPVAAAQYLCSSKSPCGPDTCANVNSSLDKCFFSSNETTSPTDKVASVDCKACQQESKMEQCRGNVLWERFSPYPSVLAAYCSNTHLVIFSEGKPDWTSDLANISSPTVGLTSEGNACVTGIPSLTTAFLFFQIPLNPVMLPGASTTNNLDRFPRGGSNGASSPFAYINSSLATYGLPASGPIGVSISGSAIWPLFNSEGKNLFGECSLASCSEALASTGGQPNIHGDPFGPNCLYDRDTYGPNPDAHPPLIGWALDGFPIYGRQLSTATAGFGPLDDCGGHAHPDIEGYHYHTQVLELPAQPNGLLTTAPYSFSTPGPYKCFLGDLDQATDLSMDFNSDFLKPCCSMVVAYRRSDVTLDARGLPARPPTRPPANSPAYPGAPGGGVGGGDVGDGGDGYGTGDTVGDPDSVFGNGGGDGTSPAFEFPSGRECPTSSDKGLTTSIQHIQANYPVDFCSACDSVKKAGVDLWLINSSGCPPYNWKERAGIPAAIVQNYKNLLPVYPIVSTEILFLNKVPPGTTSGQTKAITGTVGFTLSGIPLRAYANPRNIDEDMFALLRGELDSCRGRVDPANGQYHYFSDIRDGCMPGYMNPGKDRHSPMLGVMADGIPIFGPLGDRGVAPGNLDQCRMHIDVTYPYPHYHVTASLTQPYLVPCLRGCVFSSLDNPSLAPYVKTRSDCTAQSTSQFNFENNPNFGVPWVDAAKQPPLSIPDPPPTNYSEAQRIVSFRVFIRDLATSGVGSVQRSAVRTGISIALQIRIDRVALNSISTASEQRHRSLLSSEESAATIDDSKHDSGLEGGASRSLLASGTFVDGEVSGITSAEESTALVKQLKVVADSGALEKHFEGAGLAGCTLVFAKEGVTQPLVEQQDNDDLVMVYGIGALGGVIIPTFVLLVTIWISGCMAGGVKGNE